MNFNVHLIPSNYKRKYVLDESHSIYSSIYFYTNRIQIQFFFFSFQCPGRNPIDLRFLIKANRKMQALLRCYTVDLNVVIHFKIVRF